MKITISFDPTDSSETRTAHSVTKLFLDGPQEGSTGLPQPHVEARIPPGTSPPPPSTTVDTPPAPLPPAAPPPPADGPVVAPAPPPPPPADGSPAGPSGAALDSAGYPWDKKFHVDSKKQTKDGQWRRRRNFNEEEFATAYPAPGTPEAPGASEPPAAPPTPPAAPVPPAAAPAPANGAAVTWEVLGPAITARSAKYPTEKVQEVLRAALIEPSTLFATPAQYAQALQVLDTQCPI